MNLDTKPEGKVEIDSFDKQLDALRAKLLCAQEKMEEAGIEINAHTEQIKMMEALISKRHQIIEEYREAYSRLYSRQCDLTQAYQGEKNCLEEELGEVGKKKICCIVNKERRDIYNLSVQIQGGIEKLDGKCSEEGARKQKEKNRVALDKAKKQYELWTNPVKSFEAQFKELDAIKKEIEKERIAGHYAYAYYLLAVSEKAFSRISKEKECRETCEEEGSNEDEWLELVKPEKLVGQLKKVWSCYANAEACFNKSASTVKSLEQKLETNMAQLTVDKKNLEDVIKRRLVNFSEEQCEKDETTCSEEENKNQGNESKCMDENNSIDTSIDEAKSLTTIES